MPVDQPLFRMKPLAALLCGALLISSPFVQAYDAEIVSVIGKGETRASTREDWRVATIKQKLNAGAFVRTGDVSQMALLLQDQTQLRLNQNSMLQIKEVSLAGAPTKLEMTQGRVWTQSKRKAVSVTRDPVVTIQTPSATAAIRGTDWELVVDKAGVSTLTVLSGEVEFYNDQGRLSVRPNEQARAEPGKAPTKLLLTNARERVQWVTAYRPQPRRWLRQVPAALGPTVAAIEDGRYADALAVLEGKPVASVDTALLLADLQLFLGRAREAIALLEPRADDPRAAALLVVELDLAGQHGQGRHARLVYHQFPIGTANGGRRRRRLNGHHRIARDADRLALGLRPGPALGHLQLGRGAGQRHLLDLQHAVLVQAQLGLILQQQGHLAHIAGTHEGAGVQFLFDGRGPPVLARTGPRFALTDHGNDLGIVGLR